MKYYGFICLLLIHQLWAMDKPPRASGSEKPLKKATKNAAQFDWLFKLLPNQGGPLDYSTEQRNDARYLLQDDTLLTQISVRHKAPKPEIKGLLERFLNADSQMRYNSFVNSAQNIRQYKKYGLGDQGTRDLLLLIAIFQEYATEQKYEITKDEKYFRSRTSQELAFINQNLDKIMLENERVVNKFIDLFPMGLIALGNLRLGISRELDIRSAPALTKNQQKNADFIYDLYSVGKIDLNTYLPLKTNSELDRLRSYLEESKTPSIRNYLLQRISQQSLDAFIEHMSSGVNTILKSRSKPKRLPEGLNSHEQLFYRFVERYMQEGDTLKLSYNDQDKDAIKKEAQAIYDNKESLNKLAEWLSVEPSVAPLIINRGIYLININKKNEPISVKKPERDLKNPWPDYPPEEPAEKQAPLAKLPIIQERIRTFNVQDFINYALDNNPKLNDLIKDSSDEQLAAVLIDVGALIASDEKVVKKYQERFEVTPRRDLAKLRLLVQFIDQELKRRKEELFRRHPSNKPHPQYPESPR